MKKPKLNKKAENAIKGLSSEEKDDLYRYLHFGYVLQDVLTFAKDEDRDISDEEAESIAALYVYEGRGDCNLTYWANIEFLIDEVITNRTP